MSCGRLNDLMAVLLIYSSSPNASVGDPATVEPAKSLDSRQKHSGMTYFYSHLAGVGSNYKLTTVRN